MGVNLCMVLKFVIIGCVVCCEVWLLGIVIIYS